jgi:hypothetical protein
MNDNDFEKQLREWMADRTQPLPDELETLEASAQRMRPPSRWLPRIRLAGAVVAAAALAGVAIWAGESLRDRTGAHTPSPSSSSSEAPSSGPSLPSSDEVQFPPTADRAPAWSADAQWIAFERQENGTSSIFLVRPDGTDLHRLSDGGRPTWSPDGEWIAFELQPPGEKVAIFRVRTDGTDLQRLTAGIADEGNPAWSPDGTTIAYQSERGCCEGSAGSHGIWLMNADGSNQRQLTDGDGGADVDPAWSPDGTRLAISSTRGGVQAGRDPTPMVIWTMRSDGTDLQRVSQMDGVNAAPTWSADGSSLAWYDARGNTLVIHNLALFTEQTLGWPAIDPAWSPGGGMVAYSSQLPASEARGLAWGAVSGPTEILTYAQLTPDVSITRGPDEPDLWHAPAGTQPRAGPGWRLISDPTLQTPSGLLVAATELGMTEARLLFGADLPDIDFDREILVIFTYSTSSTCDEMQFRGLEIDRDARRVSGLPAFGHDAYPEIPEVRACTTDGQPHSFVVSIERASLPEAPFTIRLYPPPTPDCEYCDAEVVVRVLG